MQGGLEIATEVASDTDRAGGASLRSYPVAITGMHRSGTSMVAKVLHQAGLHLGDQQVLMPAAEQNPEGFFEHMGFVNLNDELLSAAGGGWDCPPAAAFNWEDAALEPFRERARVLAGAFTGETQWGWKDPRTSLTLPFWRSVLGPLRVVVVVRNPLEVISSLNRRNGFSFALGLTLWQIYAERVLAETEPEERLFTHYDAYFVEPEREISRLTTFIGMDCGQDIDTLRAAAVPTYRHHRKTILDLETFGVSRRAIELYRRLCREAEWWEGSVGTPDGAIAEGSADSPPPPVVDSGAHVDFLRIENDILRRLNIDYAARLSEVEAALKQHEASRREMEGWIADRDTRIVERDAQVTRRDQAIAILRQQIDQQAKEIAGLQQRIANLTEQLAESERARAIAAVHEREQRSMLTSLHAMQLHRDAEIMGTLGAVLSRHAPGSPAAIYHRQLVQQVRRLADEHLPPGEPTLVAAYGDEAMLDLGDRPTEHFPRTPSGIAADYTDIGDEEAVSQLEARRKEGAAYLLVPGTALPWLASHRALDRHLATHYPVVAQERGIVTIYALQPA